MPRRQHLSGRERLKQKREKRKALGPLSAEVSQ